MAPGRLPDLPLTPVACGYMILYADYGPHEHVFSPVSTGTSDGGETVHVRHEA